MVLGKYKYYFRKPKSEIVKDILLWLAVAGMVYVAASSPYFVLNLQRQFKRWKKYKREKISSVFSRLRKEGCIKMVKRNHDIHISLTEKGKKKAGWLQIDSLEIKRPKKWDGKWRIILFDISELKRLWRDAFRAKLKELGFHHLQKSVWICPFDCRDEIELLREFFGLSNKELRLITCEDIGEDDWFRKHFNLPNSF